MRRTPGSSRRAPRAKKVQTIATLKAAAARRGRRGIVRIDPENPFMSRLLRRRVVISALSIGVVFPLSVADAQRGADPQTRIVGSWRIVSYELEFQDGSERRFPFGTHPNGYLIFGADGRMMSYL